MVYTMKKIIAILLAAMSICSLCACTTSKESTESKPSESAPASSDQPTETATPTPTPTPIPTPTVPTTTTIHATYTSGSYTVEESAENTVTVTAKSRPAAGDKVTADIGASGFLKVQSNGLTNGESFIVYLPDGKFEYVYQANSYVYMPSVTKKLIVKFTIPTTEELTTIRNLALNPFDHDSNSVFFPHATSNNVYDQSGQFIPRNAIDGFSSNKGHGNYPLQSWGPRANVLATDYFTIDFGRTVSLSSLALSLRADGFGGSNAHDAYFSKIVLEFSDGSTVEINPTKTADKQTFEFEAKNTTYVKLTGFVTDKSNSQGWAAITEIEAFGTDIVSE